MKVGLAQIDTRLGDFASNRRRIVAAAREAAAGGADLVVFPELAVTGYPPRDLLYDPGFVAAALAATEALAADLAGGPPVVVGTVARAGPAPPRHPGLHDVAAVLHGGRIVTVRAKSLLPVDDVFHEPRWFVPGASSPPVKLGGRRLGLLVCEDLWSQGHAVSPGTELRAAGADLFLCLSASPFRVGVLAERLHHGRRLAAPLVYVNAVGASDELIFDGASFVLDGDGRLRALLPRFAEAVVVVDLEAAAPSSAEPACDGPADLYAALVLGVRDFAMKNGLSRAFLGLSGGIDSALVACIACDALGSEAVTAVAIPSRHTDPRSTAAARELSARLGTGLEVVPLEALHAAAEAALAPLLDRPDDTTAENLQARLRAVVLMAYVNRHGGVLLNTSNKTELALGYGTLYGDMAGTLAVIGDLTKTEVYAVARWYNERRGVIPPFVLERAPTAELRPDQVDPFDYGRVAPLVDSLVRGSELPAGADAAEVARLSRLIKLAEHKRWQAGIVLKLSDRAFGSGRMMPVTRA